MLCRELDFEIAISALRGGRVDRGRPFVRRNRRGRRHIHHNRDERCSMVNFDPDSARPAAEVLKAIVRVRDNKAGVYGAGFVPPVICTPEELMEPTS